MHRTGFRSNDAYTAYIEMGSPKKLTEAQIAQLNELTRDLPETDKVVHSGADGTVEVTVSDEQQRHCAGEAVAGQGSQIIDLRRSIPKRIR